MKRRSIIILASVLTLTGIGVAAYLYYRKEKNLITQYKTNVQDFQIVSTSPQLWVVNLVIRLTNMSDIEATIKKFYSDVYLNTTNVGFVVSDVPTVIPARKIDTVTQLVIGGTADIKVQLSFSPKIVFGNAVDILLGTLVKKDVPWRLKGYVNLSSGFVPLNIPFDIDGTLADFL